MVYEFVQKLMVVNYIHVLILVFVEDGLRVNDVTELCEGEDEVLILVFVEDGLRVDKRVFR